MIAPIPTHLCFGALKHIRQELWSASYKKGMQFCQGTVEYNQVIVDSITHHTTGNISNNIEQNAQIITTQCWRNCHLAQLSTSNLALSLPSHLKAGHSGELSDCPSHPENSCCSRSVSFLKQSARSRSAKLVSKTILCSKWEGTCSTGREGREPACT